MDSELRVKRKEGYLVKKGHVRHNWKTRWFVLYDERLSYYKKKGDKEPAGYVLLQGCFLVSPCTEYTKKESVFRLTSKEGIEYLIQAVNNEERDRWTSAIAECIRKLEARDRKSKAVTSSKEVPDVHKTASFQESLAKLRDILDAMQDPNAGVPLDNHYCRPESKTHKLCFTGVQLVDWLLKWSFIQERHEGVALANVFLEEAHIQPVGRTSKNSFRRNRKDSCQLFVDESDALYRFSALQFSNNEDVLDFDSSDSSDSDDEPIKIPGNVIKGTIVKQGFLEKKGHLRHNWKTRKFILCKDPPTLYYCKPSKGDLPVGQLKLDNCEIKSLTKDDDLFTEQDTGKGKQKYPLMLRTRKGVKYVLRAATEMDLVEWIESLNSIYDEPFND